MKKKIAIFQNFLDNIGGAEIVGLIMARELNADIYTTNIDREKIKSMGFDDVNIYSIGKVPKNAPLRQQLVSLRFRILNLKDKYDFYIINGDWAVSAAIKHSPNLWYVNATIREIWDLKDHVRQEILTNPIKRIIFDFWVTYNRYLNRKHIRQVETIFSNSNFTKDRVRKYLQRDSETLNPPTYTEKFKPGESKGYWLSVNRLISYKRVDMQLKAFAKMPDKQLLVIGPHENSKMINEYVKYINRIKPDNVTIIDHADTFEELVNYYSHCEGFITTCQKEDFGMTTIEAMSSGKPVIAPNEGGYSETVLDGKTGVLIDDINEDKLIDAVKKINKELKEDPERYTNDSLGRASIYDVKRFIEKIKEKIYS